MRVLVDHHGRSFPYLRLSLTEACNYRCTYCLPDGYHADGSPKFLALDEIKRLVRAFAVLGMSKIRLTGGEPSLRKDLPAIIAAVAAVPGIRRIALTTNGCRLPRLVRAWREAGLTAINVSLDSLDAARFLAITGHDRFAEVSEGIEQALGLGFDAVKVNAVLLRGRNDDELPAWLEYLKERDLAVRFIELIGSWASFWALTAVSAALALRRPASASRASASAAVLRTSWRCPSSASCFCICASGDWAWAWSALIRSRLRSRRLFSIRNSSGTCTPSCFSSRAWSNWLSSRVSRCGILVVTTPYSPSVRSLRISPVVGSGVLTDSSWVSPVSASVTMLSVRSSV